jgi:hypothetical protein
MLVSSGIPLIGLASGLKLAVLGHQDVLECYESGKMCQEPNFTAPEYFSERFGLLPGLAGRPKP